MTARKTPQLALRLDAAAPAADARWCAGGQVDYLGERLTLVLDTACRLPERVGPELHLPLPPAASPRQIRDTAESWLRDEALRLFNTLLQKSMTAGAPRGAPAGRLPLRIVLVFGKRGDWAKPEGDVLRCHWRLVEQPEAVIAQVLARAQAEAAVAPRCDDLFALG